jgi:hypothetical protein
MYAVLILSQSQAGIRQTVVAKTTENYRVFNRIGFARGLGSTWQEYLPDTFDELVIGQPKSIVLTPAQYRDVDVLGRTPNNVLQAILKGIKPELLQVGTESLSDVFNSVSSEILTDPTLMSKYLYTTFPTATASVIEVVTEPVRLNTDNDTASQPASPTQTPEREPAMHLATTLTEATYDNETIRETAVLTVPEPFGYVERKFNDVSETTIYDTSLANQWNVLLLGDAGTGKSSSARNLAVRRQVPFVVVECTQQIDTTVTQGRFVPGPDGKTLKWVYSQLATAIQQPSVVLLNEITRMNPKSASLFLRLLAERELAVDTFNQVIDVHPECIIIGDANIGGMYNGTTRSDAAFVDRFSIKLQFDYDTALEKKFLPYPTLLNFASAIRKAADLGQQDFTVPMSTRLLKSFVAQAQAFGWQFAVDRMLASFPSETGERDAIKTRIESDAPAIASELGVSSS